jgi:hypothetical protein
MFSALILAHSCAAAETVSTAEIVDRVRSDISYFASDELEGRGIDTAGIGLAADRILAEYKRLGIKPAMPDGTYRQDFEVPMGPLKIRESTSVVLNNGTESKTLTLNEQFQPLRRGTNGSGTGELFFVGYGISSEEDQYDDYDGVDVAGRILVMIRREPQQNLPDGAFGGSQTSEHAYIDRKLRLAVEHKAAGIIFINDRFSSPTAAKDELMPASGFGGAEASIPFVHVKQSVVDELLAAQPLKTADGQQSLSSLSEVSRYIDDNLTPVSQPITGWSASLTTEFDADVVTATNLIGVVEGEGELADETIVIGGHYDHIGYGGFGSRAPNRKGEIHNGADDNATGTAAVLEIARRIAGGPATRRRILFICFSAEEKGLLGSRYYISHPVIPLEKTVAMLNYDMIGTLRNNLVEVNGVGTAAEFYSIVKQADEASPLDIKVVDSPFAGSDHLPFFQKQIPVMFCFTGITDRYHTPEDDFEQINVEGVVSIIDYSEHLLRSIDALAQAPHFQSVSRRSRTRKIPVLGVHPNLSDETDLKGVLVKGVSPDSGAAAAGIQVADVITAINDDVIESHLDLIESLKKQSAGTVVRVRLTRNSQELLLDVQLGSP